MMTTLLHSPPGLKARTSDSFSGVSSLSTMDNPCKFIFARVWLCVPVERAQFKISFELDVTHTVSPISGGCVSCLRSCQHTANARMIDNKNARSHRVCRSAAATSFHFALRAASSEVHGQDQQDDARQQHTHYQWRHAACRGLCALVALMTWTCVEVVAPCGARLDDELRLKVPCALPWLRRAGVSNVHYSLRIKKRSL